MLPDAVGLVKTIKRAALEAMEASKPVNVCFGEVLSVSPLQINVEQKMTLGATQLILARNVTDFEVAVTVNWEPETALSAHEHALTGETETAGEDEHYHLLSGSTESVNLQHTHTITGRKELTIHNALSVGDKVILLRQQGGQKFVVIDRIGVM